MRKIYISSQGVTFIEKPDYGMKIGNVKNWVIHNWCIVGEPKLNGETYSSSGGIEIITRPTLFTKSWFHSVLIPYLKFKIVKWLYKEFFDIQSKQKVKRYGLKVFIRQNETTHNRKTI